MDRGSMLKSKKPGQRGHLTQVCALVCIPGSYDAELQMQALTHLDLLPRKHTYQGRRVFHRLACQVGTSV